MSPREPEDDNVVVMTGLQKRIYDIILSAAQENNRVTIKQIHAASGVSMSSVNAALYGNKKRNIRGLFDLVKPLRNWVKIVKRSRQLQKVDISFFLDHEAGISQQKVKVPKRVFDEG